jgi:protein-export membrane protein SecD/preprotein translocase SecF subunit
VRGIKRYVVSVALVGLIVVGVVATVFATGLRPRLGLDLKGGVSVILTAPPGTNQDILNRTITVLRDRVDSAGVAEPEISKEGPNNILIQLPGTKDPERLLKLIGQTAQLQFRPVKALIPQTDGSYATIAVTPPEADNPKAEVVLLDKDKNKLRLGPVELTGDDIRSAEAVLPSQNGTTGVTWSVTLKFKPDGTKRWKALTGRLACEPIQAPTRQIAIILDHVVEQHPEVSDQVACNQGIGDTTSLTGGYTQQQAKDVALVLKAGALPVKLEQSEVRTVSATLGQESLRAGLMAGALGLALVMLYVLVYYRALGLQTWIGLLCFSAVIYGLVVLLGAAIGWSLTLSGIAGLIVSIGIATDSYIVFFERVKEEVHGGRTLRSSMDRGFHNAWRTLRTANTVTILAAIVLYLLAVGPVRGFALALGMATTLDLVIFASLTWPLAALLARNRFFAESKVLGMRRALEGKKDGSPLARKIYRSEFDIDFIGRRKLWLAISAAFVVISLVALVPAIRGLTFGIDFRGGTVFRVPAAASLSAAEFKDAVAKAGRPEAVVQIVSDQRGHNREAQVQTDAIRNPDDRSRVVDAIANKAGVKTAQVSIEAVGSKWGQDVTKRAVRGLVIFIVLVIAYMSWRLEPKMAAAGLMALGHDLVITAGIYAIVGFEVSPATVIALLTILGYSLYDTVVVFDKIRENTALPANAKKPYGQIANESMNQTLMRSINTSLTTLLPVGSLLIVGSILLGADTLKDLALALFVGIASGTFSSIFVATPILSIWKEKEPRYASVRDKVLKGAAAPVPAGAARPAAAKAVTASKAGSGNGNGRVDEPPASGEAQPGSARPVTTQTRPTARVQQRRNTSRAKRKKGRR